MTGSYDEYKAVLSRIKAEKSPETMIQIASACEGLFENRLDDYAGDFYYSYGCALMAAGMLEEAVERFRKCYQIRAAVSGEDDWFTAIAKAESSFILYLNFGDKSQKAELIRFVDDIEEGKYAGIDHDTQIVIEGKLLYASLMDQSEISDLAEYDHYLKLYEGICDLYGQSTEPLIKRRLAMNLRGGYYLKTGDYIRAERSFIEAIDCEFPGDVKEIVTVSQIKTNLLLIYYAQNDVEMALPLLSDLLDELGREPGESGLSEKDEYRIFAIYFSIESQSMMEADPEEREMIRSLLQELCSSIDESSPEMGECTKEIAFLMICAIVRLLQTEDAGTDEQRMYLDALDKIDLKEQLFPIDLSQRTVLEYVAALLAWNIHDHRAELFFAKAIDHARRAILPLSFRISISESFAAYSARKGEQDTALSNINQALAYMEEVWKANVRYLNDERLMQILTPTQLQFGRCYAVLRKLADAGSMYERVLQFKGLASLAGRERNRILRSSKMDFSLLKEIRAAQNTITALETNSLLRDITDDYDIERAKLRELETVFAQIFPDDSEFVSITLENVNSAVPDNCVVIEYCYCALDYGVCQFDGFPDREPVGFDVFILEKKGGSCRLERVTIDNGDEILSAAREFVDILQAESNGTASIGQLDQVDDLRAALYKGLIVPVLSFLEGYETVYLAPDYGLVNLPFEILYDEDCRKLDDDHIVIKIECARDFLYRIQTEASSDESLIIGNPVYELKNRDPGDREPDESQFSRSITLDPDRIIPLPFSQIEAERTGKYLHSKYYTGFAASKKLLFSQKEYKNIHIATHGYFDTSDSYGNGFYSSCLLFSGVSDWLKDGNISTIYGNGIVTADEISRLDLRETELVVLSSCLSGMSEVSFNKGFHGMIGAFSAAGTHYIITHLWEANDFSTAVLMDIFYYLYAEKKQDPPGALALARRYLQQVTIGDLRNRHWFDYAGSLPPDYHYSDTISLYESMDDQVRPFKGEAYWGGFACYQCY